MQYKKTQKEIIFPATSPDAAKSHKLLAQGSETVDCLNLEHDKANLTRQKNNRKRLKCQR
jgi:hypothetical protein